MKRLLLIIFAIFLCLPVMAWNDKAAEESLDFLNRSVHSKVHSFMRSLYIDEAQIEQIKNLYKQNPELIKTKEINQFGLACVQRNQNLLNTYKNDYFIPAYNIYKKYEPNETLQDWINSIGISEISEFYEFYRATELNLEDCQKIYERSK